MDRVLLSGIVSLAIGTLLSAVLPAIGINIDLSRLLDGSITIGDLLNAIGFVLVSLSNPGAASIKALFAGSKDQK